MKKFNKYRLSIVLIFTCIILFSQLSLNACTFTLNPVLPVAPESEVSIPTAEHKRTINDYITQLKSMDNRAFQLVQLTLDTPPKDIATLKQGINSIKGEVNSVRRKMREYSLQVESNAIQNRDILLLFNTLNHINNQLFYLDQLSTASSNVEKVLFLEDFFRARTATSDTLTAIEEFISQE